MAEYLDDLLAIHHLFDVAIHVAQVLLLFLEIPSGQSGENGRDL